MPRLLKDLRIDDVSSVDSGAGRGVRVMLMKRHMEDGGNDPFSDGNYVSDITKREFTAEQRQASEDKGHAMPGGGYPIENKSDLKNAIQAIGRAKDPAKTKAHIKARAKALGASDMIPESWGKREVFKSIDFDQAAENIETSEEVNQLTNELNEAACALNQSICSIFCDDEVEDKHAAVLESFQQFQEHIAAMDFAAAEHPDDELTKAAIQEWNELQAVSASME